MYYKTIAFLLFSWVILGMAQTKPVKSNKVKQQPVKKETRPVEASNPPVIIEDEDDAISNTPTGKIYDKVDVHPGFIGGFPKFMEYLHSEINVGKWCKGKNLDSTWIEMTIWQDGNIGEVKLIKSGGCEEMDFQILTYAKNRKWIPAQIAGKFVTSRLVLKIPGANFMSDELKESNMTGSPDVESYDERPSRPEEKIYDEKETADGFVKAMFPGGQKVFMQYVQENIQFPTRCQEEGISGNAIIRFMVDKSGKIYNVTIVENSAKCKEFGLEAERVIKNSRPWVPAQMKGKPVNCYLQIPIAFRLN